MKSVGSQCGVHDILSGVEDGEEVLDVVIANANEVVVGAPIKCGLGQELVEEEAGVVDGVFNEVRLCDEFLEHLIVGC